MYSALSLSDRESLNSLKAIKFAQYNGSDATIRSDGPTRRTQQLLDRQEALKQELAAKKKELLEAQRARKETLKRQIQRAKSRITSRERKLRTRRLILMGSYLEHVTQDDPERKARLMKELDGFLERDRDRELFDLPSKAQPTGDSFAKS